MNTRAESWLVNELQIELRDDFKLSFYRKKCREKINSDNTARMFDDFEVLISSEKLLQIAVLYITLLKQIIVSTDQPAEASTLTSTQVSYANHLLEIIIRHGINELFDSEYKLHIRLIELLDLVNVRDKIHSLDVLCAYVGSIFQEIYAKYPKSMADCHIGRQLAEKYINKSYKNIAREILINAGIQQDNLLSLENKSQQVAHQPSSRIDNLISTTSQAASNLAALGIYAVKALAIRTQPFTQESDTDPVIMNLL